MRTAQAVQAAQLTFEDFFMADLNIEPMRIVGFEGLFGTLITVGIMMPIAYFTSGVEGEGFHEDAIDTLTVQAVDVYFLCAADTGLLVLCSLKMRFGSLGGSLAFETIFLCHSARGWCPCSLCAR